MNTAKEKETRLSIRVSPEELGELKSLAEESKMTLADWVRKQLLGHGDDNDLKNRINTLEKRLADIENRLSVA